MQMTKLLAGLSALALLAACATEAGSPAGSTSGDDSVFDAAHCGAPIRSQLPTFKLAALACTNDLLRADLQYCGCTLYLQSDAAQQDPARWYDGRGAALLRLGESERAMRDLNEALDTRPDLATAYLHRGNVFAQQKDYGRAIVDYNQALQIDPKSAPALGARCWARAIWHKNFESALADCNAALALAGDDATALASRGLVQYQLAHYDQTVDDCTASLALDPNSAGCLYLRALARRENGAEEQARADMGAAKALDADIERKYRDWGVRPQ